MIIKIGEKSLSIRWQHEFQKKVEVRVKGSEDWNTIVLPINPNKRWTKCFIYLGSGPESELLVEATTKCHKDDEYSKCSGRMKSLTEALKMLSMLEIEGLVINKEVRRKIWEVYSNTTRCNFQVNEKKPRKNSAPVLEGVPDFTL